MDVPRWAHFEQLETRSLLSATIFQHEDLASLINQGEPKPHRDELSIEDSRTSIALENALPQPAAALADDDLLSVQGSVIDPRGLHFVPDKVIMADDGDVLLYSKTYQSIFVWNPASQEYVRTISIFGNPDHLIYSAAHHAIYLAYAPGEISKIDLNDPLGQELPFFRLSKPALALAAAGDYLFVNEANVTYNHMTLDRDGLVVDRQQQTRFFYDPVWSEANGSLYMFGHEVFDQGLRAVEISVEGQIGEQRVPPQTSAISNLRLISPSPDGSVVLLANGSVYDGDYLARLPNSLANSVHDALWLSGRLFTMRDLANGLQSQLQIWDTTTFRLLQSRILTGRTIALVGLPSDRLLAITLGSNGIPQFTLLNDDLLIPGEQGSFQILETVGSSIVSETGMTDLALVVLTAPPTGVVVIDVKSSDAGEVSAAPMSLIFTPENWNVAQIVTFTGINDAQVDGSQRSLVSFKINLATSDAAFHSASEKFVSVNTMDDETQMGSLVEAGGIAYFFAANHARVERFDVAHGAWLLPLQLDVTSKSLSAAHVDEGAIYVAYGTSVYRYDLEGANRQHVITSYYDVVGLHTDGDILFVNSSHISSALVYSFNKFTLERIDEIDSGYSIHGSSISVVENRLFGRVDGISPEQIAYVAYGDNGHFVGGGSAYDMFSAATRTWTFADGARVVDNSGAVFATTGLQLLTRLPTLIDDFITLGSDVPLVLRNGVVTAYRNTFVPTGSIKISHPAGAIVEIMVNATTLFALYRDVTQPSGMRILSFALDALNPPEPDTLVNPVGLAFTPDDYDVTADGSVLLYSKMHQSIFRWNPVIQSYVETIPLIGFADQFAYSGHDNAIYIGYRSGQIHRIALDQSDRTEVPFAVLPSAPKAMVAVGKYFFASDLNRSHFLFDNSGSLVSYAHKNWYAREFVWSEVNQKVYFIRQPVSPADLVWEEINESGVAYPELAPGGIGQKMDSPVWDGKDFEPPLRVSPDGTRVVLGSGQMHDALTLERLWPGLPNKIADAAWIENSLFTLFKTSSTTTHLQTWERLTILRYREFPGAPLSLLNLPGERLLVTTLSTDGIPRFHVTNAAFETVEPQSQIVGRRLFYDASRYDLAPGIDLQDDMAIALDKAAYIPAAANSAASQEHISSYSRGINGLMIDVLSLHGQLSVADFEFKLGNSNDTSTWVHAPTPTGFIVRQGAGPDGSDRIQFVWPDGAIKNQWLRVDVLPGGHLPAETFYFGNLVGETDGLGDSHWTVDLQDSAATQAAVGAKLAITAAADHNKDGVVSAADILLARFSAGMTLVRLELGLVPTAAPLSSSNPMLPPLPYVERVEVHEKLNLAIAFDDPADSLDLSFVEARKPFTGTSEESLNFEEIERWELLP